MIENGIYYNQSSGATDPLEHNHIIRTSNGGRFGTAIRSIDLTEDTIIDNTFAFEKNEK